MTTYAKGDKLTIWITGEIGDYQAEVVDDVGTRHHPGPWLRVLGDGNESWPVLKPGDYIIRGASGLTGTPGGAGGNYP